MKRLLTFILFLSALSMHAGHVVSSVEYEKFATVNVSDRFDVTIVASDKYLVKTVADERIAPHVLSYVKNGTLFLVLDEKGFTPELKKELKAKGNEEPLLKAEVHVVNLNSLVIKDKSVVKSDGMIKSDRFSMTMTDNAVLSDFSLSCSSAAVHLAKSADAAMTIRADSLSFETLAGARAKVDFKGKFLSADFSGASESTFVIEADQAEVISSGASNSVLKGSAGTLSVKASNISELNAEQLKAGSSYMTQTLSSRCHVCTDSLKVNLSGGSYLIFGGKPVVEVERIVNSTMMNEEDAARKR